MTDKEKELALYCLKASSDYHPEVCEECIKYPNCDHTIQDDVTETIIKALEQEPCEDAVSRQAVIRLAEQGQVQGFEWQIKKLTTLPPVTPTPKKGKWIEEPNCWLRCSCCKSHYPHTSINGVSGSNYCPNCGADMREVEE